MSSLQNRKIKVRSSSAVATIAVFQDGSTVDVDATPGYQYDDSFRSGAQPSGTTAPSDRQYIDLVSLENSYDTGKQLVFKFTGRQTWMNDPTNAFQFQPNDRVEFFCDVPDTTPALATPAWHLNGKGGQQRLFYGFITSVKGNPDTGLTVTCKDAMRRANRIKVERDAPNGISIPKIAFNLARDHADFWYGVKMTTSSTSGSGETTEADSRMTVRQILEYFRSAYDARLVTEEVLDGALSGFLFPDADLVPLNNKPGPIVLENVGLAEAIKTILRTWAPDLRLIIDHTTTQWRLVPFGPALRPASTAGTTSLVNVIGQPYKSKVSVSDTSIFTATPGLDGNRTRVYAGTNAAINEELSIHSIVGSELRFNETAISTYAIGAKLYPIDAETLANFVLTVDKALPGGVDIELDDEEVYTAVKLYSVYQVTESQTLPWNEQDLNAGALQPAWDRTFDSVWLDKDSDREADFGDDGQGCKPYRLGDDGTRDYLDISYGQSQFGELTPQWVNNEWKDCSIHVWSENGADVRNANRTFQIHSHAAIADVGDGTAGHRFFLVGSPGTFLGLAPNFKTIDNASATEDRVILTQSLKFATTKGNNKRWEVGRKWYFTDTTIVFDRDSTPHQATCRPVKMQADNGIGTSRRITSMAPNLGYPVQNQNVANPWEQLAGGGIGAFHVFRRATYSKSPVGTPCQGGVGYQAPKVVNVEYEITKTTMRTSRVPASGYGGVAFARFGLASELAIAVGSWENDSQSADFDALAERLWAYYQAGHSRGTITMPGAKEFGIWLDLGVRVSLTSAAAAATFGSTFHGFWGALTEFSIDFTEDSVTFGFDSASRIQDLAFSVYEDFAISKVSQVQDLAALLKKLNQLPECLAGSQFNEIPEGLCDSRVIDSSTGRPYGPKGKTSGKDNQSIGVHATSVGWGAG